MVKSPHVIWASVAIIAMLTIAVVLLALNDKDVVVVITLAGLVAIPVLSAFGVAVYQKLDQVRTEQNAGISQVKDLANGSNDKLLEMVKELHTTVTGLALQVRPPEMEPDVKQEGHWEK